MRMVALPAAAWAGALVGLGPPRWVSVVGLAAALATRRMLIVAVALGVLVGSLSLAAHRGLSGLAARDVDEVAPLVVDPEPRLGGAWRTVVRVDGRRVEVSARGSAGGALQTMLAGESARVVGRLSPLSRPSSWATAAHLAGRIEARVVEHAGSGPPAARGANVLRRTMVAGAGSLTGDQRALLLGVLVGDDRALSPLATDAAQAAGLSHLTAVSGQNVALLVGLLGPLLARLGLGGRLTVTCVVLAAFVLVTRAEPSVMRAAVTAGGAAVATAVGRPLDGLRALALAVTVLLVVDPLLVHALGFRLSVAATAGILLLAGPVADRLPGPRSLATAVSVSASAQLAVAPLLLASGLDVPVVALPANVLAGPLVAMAMSWGIVTAPLAGWLGEPVASWLHRPDGAALGLVLAVAEHSARLGLGSLGWWHLGGAAAGGLLAVVARRPGLRRLGSVAVAVVLVAAAVPPPGAPDGRYELGPGAAAEVVGGRVVVVLDGRADARLALRRARHVHLGSPDLVVLRSPGSRAAAAAEALRQRFRGRPAVVAPVGASGGHVTILARPAAWDLGDTVVEVAPRDGGLEVRFRAAAVAGSSIAPRRSRVSRAGRGPPRRCGRRVV